MTKPANNDLVLEALEDAISYMAEIGAVIPWSYHRAIAIQKAQVRALTSAQAYCWSASSDDRDILERDLDALDKLREGK